MQHDELERSVGFLIHDVARLMQKAFDQRMEPMGITRSQRWVLVYLYRQDGVTQRQLSETLDIGKVALSGLLDRLETKGWIERLPDPDDRRAKRVFLTNKADDVLDEMITGGDELMEDITAGITGDHMDQLADMLMGLKANLIASGYGPRLSGADADGTRGKEGSMET
jgi:MarR family transcriptional regulator for hemolysin